MHPEFRAYVEAITGISIEQQLTSASEQSSDAAGACKRGELVVETCSNSRGEAAPSSSRWQSDE